MKWLWSCVFSIVNVLFLFGQCPTSDFAFPTATCLDGQLELENQSANSSEYQWFFCDTDFSTAPSKARIVSNYGAVYNSKFLQDGQNVFLFFVSQTQNKLIGLRFTDLASWDYEVHCEFDISSLITNPAGIDIAHENGTWTGFVTSIASPFKLVKIVFGQNFQSIASSEDMTPLVALSTPFDVKALQVDGQHFVFLSNSTGPVSQQLVRLSFGSSLSNVPAVSYIALPAASQAASVEFYHSCDQWTAFISSRNGTIISVNFGWDLEETAPVVTNLILSSALSDPGGLALVEDHDELVFVIQSRNGDTYSGKITSASDVSVDITNFGNLNGTTRDWGIEVLLVDGIYKVVSGNFTNGAMGGFYAIDFPVKCPANKPYSIQSSEIISFNESGTFKVTLKAINAGGDFHSSTEGIIVSGSPAPSIDIGHPSAFCLNSPVPFHLASDISLASQTWDFGDGVGTSTDPSADYSYVNAGNFTVRLNVQATNGCTNFTQSAITIYDKPEADFDLAPGLLCTNNEFLFPATSPDSFNGNLSYQWYVDGNPVSTERDLQYTFTTTGSKEIRLITSIPGCSDEMIKTTSSVEAGPNVEFAYSGTCQDETFSFQHQISDPVQSYLWDFGGGVTSPDPNPSQAFTQYGDFQVSLTATNSIGCNNVKTRTVAVHARPIADFSAPLPPNTCSGVNTIFDNETINPDGRPITEWLWDFGDALDSDTQTGPDGQHFFLNAGTYDVSLMAMTGAGCTGSVQKQITILQSPSINMSFTAACDDVPVVFTGPDYADIADWYWEIGTSYYDTSSPTHTFKAPGDYSLYLQVTGNNDCVSTSSRIIHVPIPLTPDFTYIRNCAGQEAVLTDVTNGEDAVVSREWYVNGGNVATASQLTHTFLQEGNESITLKVITEAGCTYETFRTIGILPAPVARFSPSPATGAYPLDVSFSNSSALATEYLWEFVPGSTSTELSPDFIFAGPGSYEVTLTAFNEQQCEDTFTVVITTVDPVVDADIEMINLTPNDDGSMKLIVTIHNKGNTILKELPVDLDFSGTLMLRKVIEEPILPSSRYNYVFSTGILNQETLRYLCASIDLKNDVAIFGNRMCKEFENRLFAFPAYPNPARGVLNVECISEVSKTLRISLIDALGKNISSMEVNVAAGLNHQLIDLHGFENGLYLLLIDDGTTKSTQRIVVFNNP